MATPPAPSLKRPSTAVDDAESEPEEGELSDDDEIIVAPRAPKLARTGQSQVSALSLSCAGLQTYRVTCVPNAPKKYNLVEYRGGMRRGAWRLSPQPTLLFTPESGPVN